MSDRATHAVAASSDAPALQVEEGGSQPTPLLHPYTTDDGRAVIAPLFADVSQGHPTSPKELRVTPVDFATASALNAQWHSVLPRIGSNFGVRAYVAERDGVAYAVAVWSRPIAANRLTDGFSRLELRRMAVPDYAPRHTASWFLSVMSRLLMKRADVTGLLSYQATDVHKGTMYLAASWHSAGPQRFQSWNTHSRQRPDDVNVSDKVRWEYP